MRKLMQLTVVLFAVASVVLAAPVIDAPELDGGTIASGLGLLFASALMIRRKR